VGGEICALADFVPLVFAQPSSGTALSRDELVVVRRTPDRAGLTVIDLTCVASISAKGVACDARVECDVTEGESMQKPEVPSRPP
jgi:hypothetical protein